MHLDLSVVADQSQLAKFVQEKAHAGSGRSDHLRQRCLIDRSVDGCWPSIFSEIGEQKQKACTPSTHRGFGTRVAENIIAGQLKGEVRFDWRNQGLVCEIALPLV